MHRYLIGATAMVAIATPLSAQDATAPVTMTVRADNPGATISRDIFGQFAEQLGTGNYDGIWVGRDSKIPNVRGIRTDVVKALAALKIPNVRWPGGCYADDYHWQDGVGPTREATVNAAWGNVPDSHAFGTDEFMDFLSQINSEAYISLNVGSGTVKEAADWIAYMTAPVTSAAGKRRAANGHPAPYRVKFAGLGNESWDCGGAMSPDFYVSQMKLYARFVHNFNTDQKGDFAMKRVAVGPGAPNPAWTETVMQAWKKHSWAWNIEALSLHYYTVGGWPPSKPSTGFGETDYATLTAETLKLNAFLDGEAAVMDKYDPEKKVAISVDEWGLWLAPDPGTNKDFLRQQNSLRDAINGALYLNMFVRRADRIRMANIAQMVDVLQAMVLTDGPKMVLTPTYHLFKMYLPFQDATAIPVTFDAGTYRSGSVTLPRVDAIAGRDAAGKLWLAVTNIDPNRPVTLDLALSGVTARGATGTVLTAPRVDSVNTFAAPDAVRPVPISGRIQGGKVSVTLPAKSVAVLAIAG